MDYSTGWTEGMDESGAAMQLCTCGEGLFEPYGESMGEGGAERVQVWFAGGRQLRNEEMTKPLPHCAH